MTANQDSVGEAGSIAERRELESLAAAGDPHAKTSLALLIMKDPPGKRDLARAAQLYRQAAEFQSPVLDTGEPQPAAVTCAQHNLASMYLNGTGVPKDIPQAVLWFTKAAENGDSDAQFSLALIYGREKPETLGLSGFEQCLERAAFWYEQAAQCGSARAQYDLALLYESGRGVARDMEKAILWYGRAAQQGLVGAQERLREIEGAR